MIWGIEVSHNTRGNHAVTGTNCAITVRAHLPRRDTCPTNTKRHLLKRFAEKLKRCASAGHLWPYVIPDLVISAPSETKQNAPHQWPEELSFLVLCSPRANTRLRGNCCAVSWYSIKAFWRGKERVRHGEQRPSQHGHENHNQLPDRLYPSRHRPHTLQIAIP